MAVDQPKVSNNTLSELDWSAPINCVEWFVILHNPSAYRVGTYLIEQKHRFNCFDGLSDELIHAWAKQLLAIMVHKQLAYVNAWGLYTVIDKLGSPNI